MFPQFRGEQRVALQYALHGIVVAAQLVVVRQLADPAALPPLEEVVGRERHVLRILAGGDAAVATVGPLQELEGGIHAVVQQHPVGQGVGALRGR
jgi:hypothetical protein